MVQVSAGGKVVMQCGGPRPRGPRGLAGIFISQSLVGALVLTWGGTELPEPFPFLFLFLSCLVSSCFCFCCFCIGLVVSSLVWLSSCFALVFFSLFWLSVFVFSLFSLLVFGFPFLLASLGVLDCPSHRQVNLSGWIMFLNDCSLFFLYFTC